MKNRYSVASSSDVNFPELICSLSWEESFGKKSFAIGNWRFQCPCFISQECRNSQSPNPEQASTTQLNDASWQLRLLADRTNQFAWASEFWFKSKVTLSLLRPVRYRQQETRRIFLLLKTTGQIQTRLRSRHRAIEGL